MINISVDIFTNRTKSNFSMTFANGYTVSLAMGEGMYSTAGDGGFTSAEVGAWDKDGDWVKLSDNDDVIGWQSPEQVLAIMNKIAAMEQGK